MAPFTTHQGLVAPLDRANVDTDQIIPKQFLKSIRGRASARTCSTRGATSTTASRAWTTPSGRSTRNSCSTSRATPAPRSCWRGEFRLRLESRARALGACRVRLPRADRAELRRHLLQQLLQERRAADRARRSGRGSVCSRKCWPTPGYKLTDRPRRADRHHAVGRGTPLQRRPLPQAVPAQRLGRHRSDVAPRRQDPRLRGRAPRAPALACEVGWLKASHEDRSTGR